MLPSKNNYKSLISQADKIIIMGVATINKLQECRLYFKQKAPMLRLSIIAYVKQYIS